MTIVPPPRPRMTSRYYAEGVIIGDKYELIRSLGEGGMGSVWLAKNLALDSQVALKLLRAELDAPEAGERLLQEARAAARLGHRAIVRVFDFGHTEQGDPYLVMELLDGQSLADTLAARSRLSPVKAVQMLLPVVDALATAHEHGIVHRDLKPENIFLCREPRRTQPKVVDFGIAKVANGVASRALTQQGTVLGSPGYMAPEQARGLSTIDHRCDIWALTVVLYECITGVPAFDGENYNSIMRSIIEDPVLPITELAAGDAALWDIIERGLQKNPDQRWATMHEFGSALARWLLSHAVEQDVCGEPLTSWLEEPEAPKSRDLLSVPPPSLLSSGRVSTPGGVRTMSATPERTSAASFRPGPESTAGVAHSTRASFSGRQGSLALAVAIVILGIGVAFVVARSGASHAPAAASTGAPPVSAPLPAEPVRLPPPVVVSAPSANVPPPPVSPPAAQTPTSPRVKRAAASPPAKVQPRTSAPAAGGGLKDPY